ncbi:MAG: hypothetical protein AB8B63_04470 [Granulosicoccus sp.]
MADDKLTVHTDELILNLQRELRRYENMAIAVSGGVDSVTLAAVAHSTVKQVRMIHAVSPAVPFDATERVKDYAERFDWHLTLVDAGEFRDKRYVSNPVNRCYYCKSNLYHAIKRVWEGVVASGANLDDLGDYRPGLLAAHESQVVHPLIDAGIDKSAVRRIADSLALHSVADLPAQPCLSSRVETGIAINADDLFFIHKVEKYLSDALGPGNIRCRIAENGVRLELPEELMLHPSAELSGVKQGVERLVMENSRILLGYTTYVKGSAFIQNSETDSIS